MTVIHAGRTMATSTARSIETTTSTGGQVALGLSYFLTVLSTAMMLLRFWSRKLSRFGIGLDDWLALATLFMFYFVLGLSVVLVYQGGAGKSLAQAIQEQPESPVTSLKLLYMLEWAYLLTSPLMKLSVLAYYWRMFPTKTMKKYIWLLTSICGIWFIGVLVGNLVECQPISYFWTKLSAPGTGICHFRVEIYLIIVAAPNIFIDLMTVILPVYEVWHLQLARWKRIAVSAIFLVGGMVVIASIIRLILLVAFYFKQDGDLTRNLLLPWFVTVAEIGVGIVGACLPCLMPVYRLFRRDYAGSRHSGYGCQSSLRSYIPGRTPGTRTVIAGHSGGKKAHTDQNSSGHPFERLPTGGTTPGDPVPLQGIHIRHDVTVQLSTTSWGDEYKIR